MPETVLGTFTRHSCILWPLLLGCPAEPGPEEGASAGALVTAAEWRRATCPAGDERGQCGLQVEYGKESQALVQAGTVAGTRSRHAKWKK